MEFQSSSVYFAASEGNLGTLKILLSMKTPAEILSLVSAFTDDATPLIMACKNGHLDVVQYLIDKCHADVEQVGTVTIDDEKIEKAPPLWCASAAGHLHIVKLLIKHKASVNNTTQTKSTPLRAACFDGHYLVAKYLIEHGADFELANRHGHTSLMIACYKGHYNIAKYLVECGADINRKSFKGNTALHDSAESGNIEILKLLLKHGAKMDPDASGITPLLSAALYGHSLIVQYFIEEHKLSTLEIVNALELLGATLIDKKASMITALDCWKYAMLLRYENNKNRFEKPIIKSPIGTEVRTLHQLNDLISDPDEIRMQALLVRERILGPSHPDSIYYIRTRGAVYAGQGNFDLCIKLWKHALEVLQQSQEPLNITTLNCLTSFTELFCFMISNSTDYSDSVLPVVQFLFPEVLYVFKRAMLEIENISKQYEHASSSSYSQIINIGLHLIGLMCHVKSPSNVAEEIMLMRAVSEFVHLSPRTATCRTPLHLACLEHPLTLGRSSLDARSVEVVNLLLQVGACTNAMDIHHNTPLHLAAKNSAIFKLLLSNGAHLDVRNLDNKTPFELACNESLIDIYPLRYLNLQCLCAQAINTHGLSYEGKVHKQLCEFLDHHCQN